MRTNALILVWPLALAAQGAGAPADNQPQPTVHWAFVAPVRPAPPSLKRKESALNPIDRFILARLEQEGVAPSPCADRVNTTATVFLGVTLGCAQCHDHKFDPFTQREYHAMFAFFNSTEHDGHGRGDFGPVLELPAAEEKKAKMKEDGL